MVKKLYTEANIQDIANAIRSKSGSSSTYTTAQMAAAILAIPTGGGGNDTKLVFGTVNSNSAGAYNIQHNLGKRPRVWGLIRQDDETNLLTGTTISYKELISVFCFINPAFDEDSSPTIQQLKLYSAASSDTVISDNVSQSRPLVVNNGTCVALDSTTPLSTISEGIYRYINHNYFGVYFRDSAGNSLGFAKTNTNYFWFVAG